jgi:outer membrane lipoprotein SlyB
MKVNRFFSCVLSGALLLTVVGCVSPTGQTAGTPGAIEIRQGVIEQITTGTLSDSHHTGLGAVVGGLAGLGIGSLIGGGSGRDVAMVAGALGGALAGNAVQKKYDAPVPAQQIIVRVRSGVLVEVTQPAGPNMSVGQNVYIEGNGEGARVVPQ